MEDEKGGTCGTCGGSVDRNLIVKSERKSTLKHAYSWENNIKVDHKELSFKGVGWIDVVQVRDKWCALLNTVKVSYNVVINCRTGSFSRRTLLVKLSFCHLVSRSVTQLVA